MTLLVPPTLRELASILGVECSDCTPPADPVRPIDAYRGRVRRTGDNGSNPLWWRDHPVSTESRGS